eukprot:m.81002 g.81002  ORF g.81002 m.81002 type:complete len:80 (-) comp9383_c1_seq1:661-900(-)
MYLTDFVGMCGWSPSGKKSAEKKVCRATIARADLCEYCPINSHRLYYRDAPTCLLDNEQGTAVLEHAMCQRRLPASQRY